MFNELKEICYSLKIVEAPNRNVYSSYGNDLIFNNLPKQNETTFSILYKKENAKKDFSDLIPFFFLREKYKHKVSLGIDINSLDEQEKNDYIFSSRQFFALIKDNDSGTINENNTIAGNSLYLIHDWVRVDKETGEIRQGKTSKLGNKDDIGNKDVSRFFAPLIEINENNYEQLFNKSDGDSHELSSSIRKITENLMKFPSIDYRYPFEQWFIKSYFYSLEKDEREEIQKITNKFYSLQNLLKLYCDSIKELVENIIYHTDDKKGFIYFIFSKKENLSEEQGKTILDFDNNEKYGNTVRFVEIGIMDFNEKGILDTYKPAENDTEKPQFLDFFDTKKIHTTGLDRLYMRYAAHLGIKTFANVVKNLNGSFYVESNNNGAKEAIKYYLGELPSKSENLSHCYNGTYYEIIFPIKGEYRSYSNYKTPVQYLSFSKEFIEYLKKTPATIKSVNFNEIAYVEMLNKKKTRRQEEAKFIEVIGNLILSKIDNKEKNIALNMKEFNNLINTSLLFKLSAYLQLNNASYFESIILTHLSDNLIDNICWKIKNLLLNGSTKTIWSKQSALILINDKLRVQIICGETKDELLYLNNKVHLYYPNRNYFANSDTPKNEYPELDRFIFPYEYLIEGYEEIDFMKHYVSDILDRPIESKGIGCKVDIPTRINSRLILGGYYEADFLFRNSFFADRFAYFIAKEIKNVAKKENIILIGYCFYSELILKTVQNFVNKTSNSNMILSTIIADENNEDDEIRWRFGNEEAIIEKPTEYNYIVIAPIGSTLTTVDKIIALFKQYIKSIYNKSIDDKKFIYKYCPILVRDSNVKDANGISKMEKIHKWKSVDENIKIVKTNLINASEVRFLIQKQVKWIPSINEEYSFPKSFEEEKYVNFTQNASLNSQNLFGYPLVPQIKGYSYDNESKRLDELKENILYGHIVYHKNHNRYIIETSEYIKRTEKKQFNLWLETIKAECFFKENRQDIIITPISNTELDFVNEINREIFANRAVVLCIDINNWRNNINYKFSFLQEFSQATYHFVDHSLLSGEAYEKAKSYMLSVLKNRYEDVTETKQFKFKSIITLTNKLSHYRNQEIEKLENTRIFSFLYLFIPASKDPENDCSLCSLLKHYENLKDCSVLSNCHIVIQEKQEKIKNKEYNTSSKIQENENTKNVFPKISDREFDRMKLMNRLFFEVSELVHRNETSEIEQLEQKVEKMLNDIYDKYSNDVNGKITFLKVISSQPLIRYIKIRRYAQQKLLTELKNLLKETTWSNYDNFCALKVILKQLSMLSSNALVRREVIIGAWTLYFGFIEQIPCEIEDIGKRIKSEKEEKKNKEDKLKLLESQQSSMFIPNEIEQLAEDIHKLEKNIKELFYKENKLKIIKKMNDLKQKENEKISMEKEKTYFLQKIDVEISMLKKEIEELENNNRQHKKQYVKQSNIGFQSLFQFYVKNAIYNDEAKSMWLGELLRTGTEIEDSDKVTISRTSLTNENYIFHAFDDRKKKLKNEYINFLVWLFYDNTTIIRKALRNFEKELSRRSEFKKAFDNINQTETVGECVKKIELLYKPIIEQYYYSFFNKYIGNPDGIDFIQKLIYVLYAKQLLKGLNNEEIPKPDSFHNSVKSLLNIFVKIMSADAAIFVMKGKITEDIEDTHLINYVGLNENN
ncbi:MAG: hypothetical protein LBH25_10035 [Fibromonadaceae bacterium]|nr:hypothetical protein [Fibromonadaceae bacterium]